MKAKSMLEIQNEISEARDHLLYLLSDGNPVSIIEAGHTPGPNGKYLSLVAISGATWILAEEGYLYFTQDGRVCPTYLAFEA